MNFETRKIKLLDKDISIYAFSVMGAGKIDNQDSFSIYSDENQIIIVVADGLGSAAFSQEGSKKITKVAVDILSKSENYYSTYLEILNKWKDCLEGNINQYDTTLKFIKIHNKKIIYGGVGDGWISIKLDNDLINVIAENTFSNQTDSILSFNLKDKFIIKEYVIDGNVIGLVSTDGFSEDIDKDNSKEFLESIDKELSRDESNFINDTKYTLLNWPVETNKDDKTVVFFRINEGD